MFEPSVSESPAVARVRRGRLSSPRCTRASTAANRSRCCVRSRTSSAPALARRRRRRPRSSPRGEPSESGREFRPIDVTAGSPSEVALARRVIPARGQQLLGFATVVRREMPCTNAALVAGKITERSAIALVQETACLDLRDRQEVDRRIAGDLDAVELQSEKQIIGAVRETVAELDPAAVAERQPAGRGRTSGHHEAGAGHDDVADLADAGQGRRRRVGGPVSSRPTS